MSAIAAIFNLNGAPADEQQLRSMTDAVAHRGPDGIGVWASGPVGFGACLLKTTPEASFERLPYVSNEGRYVVALDGRIDNRRDLASALNLDGPTLATTPDSELLLASYLKWGKKSVERIVGDFAFAIWDSAQRIVFCGRDPIGVRMLHYYCDGKRFVAATEVSQILSVIDTEVDTESVALFLDIRTVPVDRTFIKGVKKLPGGCSLTISESGQSIEVYWNPDPSDLLERSDDREYEEQFLELFKESIRSRMRGADPVGISLSGGMDSASIFATAEYMRRDESEVDLPELRYYSNVYTGLDVLDESDYINATVQMYDAPGKLIESGGFEDASVGSSPLNLKKAEPFIAPHEESHRRVFSAAQQDGCRTMFTGLGGDEIFAVGRGYLTDLIRTLNLRSIRREWQFVHRGMWLSQAGSAVSSLLPFQRGEDDSETADWISDKARRLRDSVDEPSELKVDHKLRSRHLQEVDSWIQTRGGQPGFTWSDVTIAEYGLTPAHPFWDRRLVDFMISVPPHVKFRYGYTKRPLRRAMKGILPELVRNRRNKTNFGSLLDIKTTISGAEEITELFRAPLLADMGLVDPVSLREAWSSYRLRPDRDNDRRTALWVAVSLERWLRQDIVDDGVGSEIGASPSQRR